MGKLERDREKFTSEGKFIPFRTFGGYFDAKFMHGIDVAHLRAYCKGQNRFRYGMDEFGKGVYHEVKINKGNESKEETS